jgi:hypothetical protein
LGDLLAKNPADRPGSAGQVRTRLIALSDRPDGAGAASPAAVVTASSAAWPQGSAPVIPPTRTLPTVHPDGGHGIPDPVPARPVGVAGLAAGLAAVIVAALLTGGPPGRQVSPAATPTATTGTIPVRMVCVRDRDEGKAPMLALVTTDLTTSVADLIARYAMRWAIEVAFFDCRPFT